MDAETKTRPTAARMVPLFVAAAITAVVALRLLAVPRSDDVAPEEIARRREALRLEPAFKLAAVTDPAQAAEGLKLSDHDRDAVLAAWRQGRLRLAWLDLFDSDAVDGDRVTVESLGLSQTVLLAHAPVRIAVAVPSDGRLHLTGADQGRGGGVTVGVVVDGRPIKLPPLAVGESLAMAVTAP